MISPMNISSMLVVLKKTFLLVVLCVVYATINALAPERDNMYKFDFKALAQAITTMSTTSSIY